MIPLENIPSEEVNIIPDNIIENYNHSEVVFDFIQKVNTEIQTHKTDVFIKNQSELVSLLTMIKEYEKPVRNSGSPISMVFNQEPMWFDKPEIKKLATEKLDEFEVLNNPKTNPILSITNTVMENVGKVKDILSMAGIIDDKLMDQISSVEDLINNLSFPEGFDIDKIKNLLKNPIAIDNLDALLEKLNIPELKLNLPEINIPNIPPLDLSGIKTGGMTGLNFNRMQKAMTKDFMKEFPEGTDWESMVKFNTTAITKAVMTELSKLTFYIEPGEIKLISNGAPTSHTGQNINRIKIKLK